MLILDLEASVINNESKHRSRHQCTEIQRLEKQIDALEPLLNALKKEDTPYSNAPSRPPSADHSTEPKSKIPAISITPEKTDNEKYCAQIAGDFTSFKFPETSAEITIGMFYYFLIISDSVMFFINALDFMRAFKKNIFVEREILKKQPIVIHLILLSSRKKNDLHLLKEEEMLMST